MPTHDYIIANGTGAAVRADINLALSAIVSLNSSASEPATMYAYQLWADTAAGLLKIRNGANSAWITLRQLDGDFSIVAVEDGLQATPSLTFTNDLNTGVFRSGADALAIVTGGQYAITCTSTQAVGIKTANPSTALHVAGNARVGADDVTDAVLEIGVGATGNRASYIDIVGDTTYTDYGLRVIRNNTGANATSELKHRGTGALNFTTEEAAPIVFNTTNSPALTITSGGLVGIGTSSPDTHLHLYASNASASIRFTNTAALKVWELTPSIPNVANSGFSLHNVTDSTVPLHVTNAGLVGIGNTGPSVALEIGAATGAAQVDTNVLRVNRSVTGQYATFSSASGAATINGVNGSGGAIVFQGDGNPRAQIDGSGRLLVGTTTARANFFNTAGSAPQQFQVEGATGNTCSLSSICSVADTSGGRLLLAHQRSGAVGGNTILNSGDQAGYITFQGNDGGEFVECASIEAVVDGTPGANDMPGRLVFSTTADGASSPTEAMRLQSNGHMRVSGTIYRDGSCGLRFSGADLIPQSGTGTNNDNAVNLGNPTSRWATVYAGTGTINTSDANLKQDIQDLEQFELNTASAIKGLIRKFRFTDAVAAKGDDARIHVGVIAQEVEQAFIDEGLDPRRYGMFCEDTLEDGTKRLGIRYDELLAFVIAAL